MTEFLQIGFAYFPVIKPPRPVCRHLNSLKKIGHLVLSRLIKQNDAGPEKKRALFYKLQSQYLYFFILQKDSLLFSKCTHLYTGLNIVHGLYICVFSIIYFIHTRLWRLRLKNGLFDVTTILLCI